MTEYWVSRKKWRCPYCDIVINDDVPSRQQHENGLRHKGAVERALKGHYKKSFTERKDKQDAEKEMKRIEAAALAAMEKDGAAYVPPPSASPPPAPTAAAASSSKPPAWKPKDASAYGSAAPDIENLRESEKKWLEEQERLRKEGRAGNWEEIREPLAAQSSTSAVPQPLPSASDASLYPPSDRELARSFKVRERTAAFEEEDAERADGLEEIRVKKRIKSSAPDAKQRAEDERKKRMLPEWRPIAIDFDGEEEEQAAKEKPQLVVEEPPAEPAGEAEPPLIVPLATEHSPAPTESAPPAVSNADAGSLFTKRKGGSKRSGKKIFV